MVEGHPQSFRKLLWGKSRTSHYLKQLSSLASFTGLLYVFPRPQPPGCVRAAQSASPIMAVTTYHILAHLPQTLSFSCPSLPSSETIHGSPRLPELTVHRLPSTYSSELPPTLILRSQQVHKHTLCRCRALSQARGREKAEDGACHRIQPSRFTPCPRISLVEAIPTAGNALPSL